VDAVIRLFVYMALFAIAIIAVVVLSTRIKVIG